MRYGIVSDIHSNLTALEAVLKALEGVDALICPGDVVGYGPDPNECCAALRSANSITVIGNHDAVVSGLVDESWFNRHARAAARHNREQLSPEHLSYLGALPVSHASEDFFLVHATASQPLSFHYVFSTGSARECVEALAGHPVCFIGHTHVSEVYSQRVGQLAVDRLSLISGGRIELKEGYRYIVNCGSVGQPRDGSPLAACGIYDSDARTVEIVRVPYDIASVQSRMVSAGLPELLIKRLEVGE